MFIIKKIGSRIQSMAKLKNVLRGVASVLNIWPDTDYSISLPPPIKVHSPVDRIQIITNRVSSYLYSGTSIDNFHAIYNHIKLLKEKNFQIRAYAIQALGQMGEAAIPALLEALGNGDNRVHTGATEALGRMGETAIPALIKALGNGDDRVRAGAAEALGRMGPRAAAAIPALTVNLFDENIEVREQTDYAIRRINSGTPPDPGSKEKVA
jgi:hypothetical protein